MQEISELSYNVIEAIQDKKGKHITHINLFSLESSSAREFIICEGNTPIQVSSIADNIREMLREKSGIKPFNYDGYRNSQWIVLDYGYLYVHIFVPELRERYNLEELWSDGLITEIADID